MWEKVNWFPMIIGTMLVAALFAGCGERHTSKPNENGTQQAQTPKKVVSVSKEDLQKYANQLPTLMALLEKNQVKMQSSYSTDKEVFLEVRRVGEHAKTLTDTEKAKLKQAIYEAIGAEFPLNITVYTIDEQSGKSGKITAIDEKGRFLIVSGDKFLDQEKKMPDAAWYGMADDAIIEFEGKKLKPDAVQIGSVVKVWSEGTMLTSYPGQTSGLRLQIITEDKGIGDTTGKVTGVVTKGEGVNTERTIEVDGVKYRLLTFAQLRMGNNLAQFTDITVGKQVKLWFAGYDIGTEKMVTKVVIGG